MILFLFLIILILVSCNGKEEVQIAEVSTAGNPAKIIYETDFTWDVDDVGALALLHALADLGEAEILAVSYNEVQKDADKAIDAVNTWYHRGDIPIGLYQKELEAPDNQHSFYIDKLAAMKHDLKDNPVGSSLEIYKKILADQPDNSVIIISVGFLNNLYDLLSDPEGFVLISTKVKKLVLMGGVYKDEFNFVRHNTVEQAQYVLEYWPGTVVVSPDGAGVQTGSALEKISRSNPVRQAYYWWNRRSWNNRDNNRNRSSWDQLAVLYAVRGAAEYFFEMDKGAGSLPNGFLWSMKTNYRMYLASRMSNTELGKVVEDLMIQKPVSIR
jgi:inosine-uridine nucleoside N-ribohydrolase